MTVNPQNARRRKNFPVGSTLPTRCRVRIAKNCAYRSQYKPSLFSSGRCFGQNSIYGCIPDKSCSPVCGFAKLLVLTRTYSIRQMGSCCCIISPHCCPVGRALPHALQDPQVNIAGIRRTGLLARAGPGNSACPSLTPALPSACHRRDRADDGNLTLLAHPNWAKYHGSTWPCNRERLRPGSDPMGFFDAPGVARWTVRD